MRSQLRSAASAALMALLAACGGPDGGTGAPTDPTRPSFTHAAGHPSVRISELHYDNASTDVGEAIEVSGPAGTDLSGWSLVLYNGTGGAVYTTTPLSGTIPATCGPRGVVVVTYPTNGIQNGAPDGVALVNGTTVVEFLSYEGTFTAVGGPANGLLSTSIGVSQSGSEAIGLSLQRQGDGTWNGPAANTFGACNDAVEPPPPATVVRVEVFPASASLLVGGTRQFTATGFDADDQPIPGASFTWSSSAVAVAAVSATGLATGVGAGDAQIVATAPSGAFASAALHVDPAPPPGFPNTRFSEIHYDNTGTDVGEAIEIEGPAGTDLTGWSVVLYNGNGGAPYNTSALTGTIPNLCGGRGVVVVNYPSNGIQNGAPDGMALVQGTTVIEFLSYEGTFTGVGGAANGMLSSDIGVSEVGTEPVGRSLQRNASGIWSGPSPASFGACNGGPVAPPTPTISFSGRLGTDPALPVGFQDQLFATYRDANGQVVPTTFTWASDTPLIAGIDQQGVMTALAPGSATLRATATDGTTGTITLPTVVATASATALYAGHAEFGEPADGDASDDYILRHPQFTTSWSGPRGTPNWVSYNLEATHFGAQDRCDCFTFDPALPAAFPRYTTADYTGAGAFHGYGIDRGHLARSFDRTAGSLDNAFTFYFSNIIPQAADNNQGPWAALENHLGDLARFQNKEVYVIAGVAGSRGTVKNEGKVTIPAQVWKVALVLPRDQGLADIDDYQDPQVIAVIMPNEAGIRSTPWQTFATTVDAVEALSGYDLLALLRDDHETAIESGTHPPVAALDGPWSSNEGAAVAMSAAASSDADGQALTYAWQFGDGGTASGVSPSHVYAGDGSYTVRLIVTDPLGLADTAFATATVSNVAPVVGAIAGAVLLPGETYTAGGSFTDPGADSWSATVDYGDGAGPQALALAGKSFTLSHTYGAAGTFTVTVAVSDDDATGSSGATVTVLTPAQALQGLVGLVQAAAGAGRVSAGNGNALLAKLEGAIAQLGDGKVIPAREKLGSFLDQLADLEAAGRVSAADAAAWRALVQRVLASLAL